MAAITAPIKHSIEEDAAAWSEETADLLEERRFDEIDIDVLAEEVRDLGLSRMHAVESQLTRLFMHLLQWQYQPTQRSRSWEISIGSARVEIAKEFRQSPSLRRRLTPEVVAENWQDARKLAALETGMLKEEFPRDCPWDLQSEVLAEDWLP